MVSRLVQQPIYEHQKVLLEEYADTIVGVGVGSNMSSNIQSSSVNQPCEVPSSQASSISQDVDLLLSLKAPLTPFSSKKPSSAPLPRPASLGYHSELESDPSPLKVGAEIHTQDSQTRFRDPNDLFTPLTKRPRRNPTDVSLNSTPSISSSKPLSIESSSKSKRIGSTSARSSNSKTSTNVESTSQLTKVQSSAGPSSSSRTSNISKSTGVKATASFSPPPSFKTLNSSDSTSQVTKVKSKTGSFSPSRASSNVAMATKTRTSSKRTSQDTSSLAQIYKSLG